MPLKKITFSLNAPFASISGEWAVERAEQTAAWEMYVELATRVAVVPLSNDEGLIREALTSFHSLFTSTRQILRAHGPDIAKLPSTTTDHGEHSFGYLATWILNGTLRPLLARWHPELGHWEALRDPNTSPRAHEQDWEYHNEARAEISQAQVVLLDYAWILAEACGAPALMVANTQITGPKST
jgi:hypothetical protein